AARDQEIRRLRCGGAAQGRARHRHPDRRHHAGLWGEVLPAGHADGGTERALDRGGDAVRRRQDDGRVAEGDQDRRPGVPVAQGACVREVACVSRAPRPGREPTDRPMPMLTVSGLTKRFGALRAVNNVSFEVNEGEILGLIGPNGSGKSTTFNCIAGLYAPNAGVIAFEGAEISGLPPYRICHKGIARTFQIPRPFRNLSLLENVALSAFFGRDRGVTQKTAWEYAEEALAMVGLPTDSRVTTDGLGAAAVKKLELARALATQPRLLLADESLNGPDQSEMEQAADMLQRIRREKNITIVWVEHIMGVLMRVVDRVVVLDHGEVIFSGAPKEAQDNARVIEVYLGSEAVA